MTKRWVGGVLACALLVACNGAFDDPVTGKIYFSTGFRSGGTTDIGCLLPTDSVSAEARLREYGYAANPAAVQRALSDTSEYRDYHFPELEELPETYSRQILFRSAGNEHGFSVYGVVIEASAVGDLVNAYGFTYAEGQY